MDVVEMRMTAVNRYLEPAVRPLPTRQETQREPGGGEITKFSFRIAAIEIELLDPFDNGIRISPVDIAARKGSFQVSAHVHSQMQFAQTPPGGRVPPEI